MAKARPTASASVTFTMSAISNINQQIDMIQSDMNTSFSDIAKLTKELDTLRIQYGESVM